MTRYEPEHPDWDDADLDDLLTRAMTGIGAKLDAGFDPAAGLADIYARSRAGTPSSRSGSQPDPSSPVTGPAAGGSRLEEACGQIDVLRVVIAGAVRSGRDAPFPGSAYLDLAAGLLTELRTGLASRSMDRRRAEDLLARVRQHLDQAGRLLAAQGSSLDDLIRTAGAGPGLPVAELADLMHEMVLRLFPAPGDRSLAAL
jgi:hypothetical protein